MVQAIVKTLGIPGSPDLFPMESEVSIVGVQWEGVSGAAGKFQRLLDCSVVTVFHGVITEMS